VLAELSKLGRHSTDITDALDATGTDWRPVNDAEVLHRRSATGAGRIERVQVARDGFAGSQPSLIFLT
jgi:hypothetical protein